MIQRGVFIALALLITSATAQHFRNDPCGRVTNTGTIRLRTAGAEFRNDAPTVQVTNDGTIEMAAIGNLFTGSRPLGATPQDRLGGTVLWSALADNQRVQARWYKNLSLAGGRKTISDSVFVSATYAIANGTGTRSYEGTFYYDGTQQQNIVPEKGDNAYRNLVLLAGAQGQPKLLRSDTATVRGFFLNHASNIGGASVSSRGVLDLRSESRSESPFAVIGTGSAILVTVPTARLLIANASQLNVDGSGHLVVSSTWQPAALTIDSGSTLRISATGTPGRFSLLGTAAMDVVGTYLNTASSLLNATYECGTTVRYRGSYANQILQATAAEPLHRYGILETSGGSKRANGDVHVGCGLLINTGSTPHAISMGDYTLTVHHSDTVLTPIRYDSALADCQSGSEVIGRFRHEGLKGALAYGQVLPFNNRFTTITFTDTAGIPKDVMLNVLPRTAPNSFNAATDVQRKITIGYSSSIGQPAWSATLRAGFRLEESRGLSGLARLAGLRTYNAPRFATPNRIGRNYRRQLDTTCEFLWVEARGITPAGPDGLLDGSDLLLRAAPARVITARDGRWSNPRTWLDESEPLPYDTAVVLHNVWVGFVRPAANGWDGYAVAERYPHALAARVIVDHSISDAALIFGADSTVPSADGLFIIGGASDYLATTLGRGGELEIIGCDTLRSPRESLSRVDFERFARMTTAAEPKERGLVIFAAEPRPTVRVNTLRNTGWIQNAGRLQIGDE
ncbi:MAG: hypothetical protein D6747_04160 [Chlorobiota bacterium]|nr:MAG: hypothetical protein D6747_04160 [Chlorobiota bacterium]